MEIKEMKEQGTMAVNLITSVSQLPTTIGEVYGEIGAYLEQKGIQMTGSPYVLYRNMDMEALDVEIGFPVNTSDVGQGRVQPSQLPGGRVVTAVHKGPYSELEGTYTAVTEFAAKEGVTMATWMYESYLNSPQDTAPEELLTQLFFPIVE